MTVAHRRLKWELRQRLLAIEARVIWAGRLSTGDLRRAFGISRSQASKDLTRYQALCPGNLRYDLHDKCYRASDSFQPHFLHGSARELLLVLRHVGEGHHIPLARVASDVTSVEVVECAQREFDVTTLQRVNAAIRDKRSLALEYVSMSSGARRLVLSPHALVFTGQRWHVRAYSGSHGDFRDFLLSRMRPVPQLQGPASVTSDQDRDWLTVVNVRIGAHPGLSPAQQAIIEQDYGMVGGALEHRMRLALVPYYLHLMRVGAGDKESEPAQQQIVLLNAEELGRYDRLTKNEGRA